MQTIASVARALYRIVFKTGSPQRIQPSPKLTSGALLALVVLAVTTQLLVFRTDLIGVSLYLITLFAGLYLGTAWLSRRTPAGRLRQCLQAGALILAVGHLLLLPAAPFAAALPGLPYALAALVAALALSGLTNCVQFARAGSRVAALWTVLLFAFALVAFYVTMHYFVGIAMA